MAEQDRRIGWIDVCRGLSMLLVVLLHSTSYYRAHDGAVPELARQFVDALAPVRMPTLFFLSGLMIHFGLKRGRNAFLAHRARILVWPYLVWLVIWAFASGDQARLVEAGWWLGGWYLWFLLFIILYSLAAALLPLRWHGLLAVYCYLGSLLMEDGTKYAERLLFFMAIFLAGSVAGRHMDRLEALAADRRLLLLAPAALAICVYSALYGPVRYSPYDVGMIAVASLVFLALCRWLAARYKLPLLRAVGRNSITVYLVHMPVIALVVAAMRALGLDSFAPVFLASITIALAVSILAVRLRPKVAAVDWLFAFPRRLAVGLPEQPAPAG